MEYIRYELEVRKYSANCIKGIYIHVDEKGKSHEKYNLILAPFLNKVEGDKYSELILEFLNKQIIEKTKSKIASYEGAFKKSKDFETAKSNNEDINDFTKFGVYRALKYNKNNHDAIERLCHGADLTQVTDNMWVIENPKMVGNKIIYSYMSNSDFHKDFKKYDASGILGCGPGSERFK